MANSKISNPKGDYKSGYDSFTVNPQTFVTRNITFDNPYPSNFSGYAVNVTQSGSLTYDNLFLGSKDRTDSGFKLVCSSTRPSSSDPITLQVMWSAIPLQS